MRPARHLGTRLPPEPSGSVGQPECLPGPLATARGSALARSPVPRSSSLSTDPRCQGSSDLLGLGWVPCDANQRWGMAIFIGSARLSVWVSSSLDLIFIVKIVKIILSGRPARDGEKPDDLRYRGALRGRASTGHACRSARWTASTRATARRSEPLGSPAVPSGWAPWVPVRHSSPGFLRSGSPPGGTATARRKHRRSAPRQDGHPPLPARASWAPRRPCPTYFVFY